VLNLSLLIFNFLYLDAFHYLLASLPLNAILLSLKDSIIKFIGVNN
jgi:hypothetical protein